MHANAVTTQKLARKRFALCESCFWSATVLAERDVSCPSCPGSSVSLIPLARDEEYRLKISPSAGLVLSFSRQDRR
ncbi:MAG: hypothetical protein QXJ74_07770 [Nitrososphaera sp.]|uniref:hypothetical protein n=1 Tax=Nitrososphaera sp. TaxID=1971748 RepID=UPI00182ACB6B|nr:hypothetical protein [Nitrososphaera sp.]NWG36539.1 hypothetical protein [Nitrososphaera sp.]